MGWIIGIFIGIVFICGFEVSYEKDGKKTYLVNIKPLSERLK